MSSLYPTYARWNVKPAEAKGSMLTDTEGNTYLDFTSGIGVLNLGHGHPKVKQAVENQLARFWHTSNLFENEAQEQAAEMLAKAAGLNRVFFANSGAEANEAAIKLARKATGKQKIITCKQSFHGRTFATMAATGQEKVRIGYGAMLAGFEYVPFNDIAALQEAVDYDTAAVMLEIIQGEGGIHPVTEAFLEAAEQACRAYGALLIIDEIQTGIGRTGKPFAFQHYKADPDIVTSAKGLGNGLPIGAMIGKEKLAEHFGPGSHGSTFGGNPVSIAAAIAVMEEVFSEPFLQETEKKSRYLFEQLQEKLGGIKQVKELRGKGLMAGIELDGECSGILERLRGDGLLILNAGPNVLRLLPPLTASYEEIGAAAAKIAEAIKAQVPVS